MADDGEDFFAWRLSERARGEISRRWPDLDPGALEVAARIFRSGMSIREHHGHAKWEEEMERIAKTSSALLIELENARWTTFSFGHIELGSRQFWMHELATKVIRIIVTMSTGYMKSVAQTDRRGDSGPRSQFILTVLRQLQVAGYGVSARPNDDLVRVLDLLFLDAGYPVDDPRKTVAHALKGAGINRKDKADRFPPDL